MIFVTLGTQDKQFKRLLDCILKNIDDGTIKDEVIVQAGSTKFKSDKMKIESFMDKDTFEDYISKADIIITHGGVGTILNSLKQNKKIIGVAREEKYGEHVNDHQKQLLARFSEEGYIIYAKDLDDLPKYLKLANTFKPKKYNSNQAKFNRELDKYIKNYVSSKKKITKKEDSKFIKLIKQALKFFVISGMGWLIDMTIFTILTSLTNIPTIICNMLSSILAVSYVYIVSTRKIFVNTSLKRNLKNKYIYYIIYQIFIILASSFVIGLLAKCLSNISLDIIVKYHKIIAKIINTPITMICNFIFMKWLIEKF